MKLARLRVRGNLTLISALVLVGSIMTSPAATAPASDCTVTWTGSAGDSSWHSAANWLDSSSQERVPSLATDRVCIPDMTPDVTIEYSAGTTTVFTIESAESLTVSGGALAVGGGRSGLIDNRIPSNVSDVSLVGGAFGGYVIAHGAVTWSGGTLDDGEFWDGPLVIAAGHHLEVTGGGTRTLDITLRIDGSAHLDAGTTLVGTEPWRGANGSGSLSVEGVAQDVSLNVGSAVVEPTGSIVNTGRLILGDIVNFGEIVNIGMDIDTHEGSAIVNHGVIKIHGWAGMGRVVNAADGLIDAFPDVNHPQYQGVGATVENAGDIQVRLGLFRARLLSNTGTIHLAEGTELEVSTESTFNDGASIIGPGSVELHGDISIDGTFNLQESPVLLFTGDIHGTHHFAGTGTVLLRRILFEGPGVTTFAAGLSVEVTGLIRLDAGRSIVNGASMLLRGEFGSVTPAPPGVTFTNTGTLTLTPLSTPWEYVPAKITMPLTNLGTIRIDRDAWIHELTNMGVLDLDADASTIVQGDVEQSTEGELRLNVDGASQTTGTIAVAGNLTLAGHLQVIQEGDWIPFSDFVTFGTRSGDFSTIGGLQIDPDLAYRIRHLAGAIRLVIGDDVPPPHPAATVEFLEPGSWTPHADVGLEIQYAPDDRSGVEGISVSADLDAEAAPDTVMDHSASPTFVVAVPEGEGVWIHLRTVDHAGNWSEPIHVGPFNVDRTPPTVTLDIGTYQQVLADSDFDMSWEATDTGVGLAQPPDVYSMSIFHLFFRDDGWVTEGLGFTTDETTTEFAAEPGHSYCFRAHAKDALGNLGSSESKCFDAPIDDRQMAEDGAWRDESGSGYYLRTYSQSSRHGRALVIRSVRAQKLTLIATRCRACGRVRIYFAGQAIRTIDLSAPQLQKRQAIRIAVFDRVRRGTVRVEIISRRKPVRIEGLGVLRRFG